MERVHLRTADGLTLDGDLQLVNAAGSTAIRPAGAAVICHPHPAYGGTRTNPVVDAVFHALPRIGIHTIRFDFRRGAGDGVAERLDILAALDALDVHAAGLPGHLIGYSFGAAVALTVDDPRVADMIAIAPPLPMMPVPPPTKPTLVLVPEHDQFCPPAAAQPIIDQWPGAEMQTVTMADHFLSGRAETVAAMVVDWLSAPPHASAHQPRR